jgi:transcriptional regulator with XRE-family HTH domain
MKPARDRLAVIFGRRLRVLRKARGLTQEQLGRAAGIDYKHIGGIERGEHSPSFDAVEKIVNVLKVEYHLLFTPERSVSGQLEDNLYGLLRDVDDVDKATLANFFTELLAAVRRLRKS